MTTVALLSQGRVVTVCCGDHRPSGCCDDNCTPCCPECVTCPEVHQHTTERRTANARVFRERHLVAGVLADRGLQRPALAAVEELVEAIEREGRAAIAGVDDTERMTRSLARAFGFELDDARVLPAEADGSFSHMEGSVA